MFKLLKDMFTGPDGKTWAIGRFYSLPMLLTGLSVPAAALYKGGSPSLSEMGIGLTGLATALTILIHGTKNVDEQSPTLLDAR